MPVPVGIAGLRHEAGDDPVKHDAVVEMAGDERLDLLDVLGRDVGQQLDDDVAVLGLQIESVGGRVVGEGRQRGEQREREQGAPRQSEHRKPRMGAGQPRAGGA